MQSANWKDVAELIGIAAIVASLIFVGLQMKQSQEIAIAAQYHQRAALTVDSLNAELEAGNLRFWGQDAGEVPSSAATLEDIGRDSIRNTKLLFIMDNHYFQYQAGFMQEEAWQAIRGSLKNALTSNGGLAERVSGAQAVRFRQSFVDLCDELIRENETELKATNN